MTAVLSQPIAVVGQPTTNTTSSRRLNPPCGDTWVCQVVIAHRKIAQATACAAKKRSGLTRNRKVRSSAPFANKQHGPCTGCTSVLTILT